MKGSPFVAEIPNALDITGAGGFTVSVRVALPVPPEFEALKVAAYTPGAVGVPEITPVVGFSVMPFARPLAAKLVGELLPAI